MQITRAGVTVQPVTFQFGVVALSGAPPGGGTGGTTGSTEVGGGGGGGGVPWLGGLLLGLGALGGIAASAPPPAVPPAVSAGPSIPATSPGVGAAPAPLVVATTPPAVGAGSKASPSTRSPIVLAASAAQAKPAAVPAVVQAKQKPGVVLPYTGANLWLPFGAGSGLVGLGIWLRRLADRFREEE
jgi:hypothetical protein